MIPHYYEDPHTLHVGTMPNRAYYIPASRRSDALVEHRETSDRFQLLNGSWKFRYYASIYDLQDAFYEVGYDASAFDSIPVPSVWQNHGYDHHQYTNIRYPFPADPPYVPKENPCGAYLYDFTYQKDAAAPRAFLNFEGVASCFYVWLNGQFVGYSQVAHSTSEFDVTKFLQDGTNHLAVLVLKWCDGSYMEDQDMFRMDFVDLTEYAALTYQVSCDGEVIDNGFIPYPDGFTLPPHSENALPLAVHIPDKGKCFLKIFYHCDKDLSLRSEGHLLGFDEILLENEDSRNQKTLAMWSDAPSNSTITVQETDRYLTLRGKNFTYNFNKLTGLFAAMQYEDAVLLDKKMEFNIWRAPTDNDRKLKLDWLAARYDHCMTNAYRTEYQVTDSGVTLRAKVGIAPISLQKFLDLDVCWTISNSGAVTLALHAERNTVFPELPRFGLRLFLPKEMARVSYFGMGPMESYCDKHHAASHGYFSSTIWQQHEDYIRPQENGSHYDCDYVQLDGAGIKLTAVGAKPFCFNASHYTQEELTEKAHNYELHPCDSTVLCLDYAQNGIGSASCGPRLAEQYRLDDASFDFSIRLIPEKA